MILIRVGEPIPPDHHVNGYVSLKPIDLEKMTSATGIFEDVTSHSSGHWRQTERVGVRVTYSDRPDEQMSGDVYDKRAMGGGEFHVCYPNGDHCQPRTETETERIEDEMASWNFDYYNDEEGDEEDE